MIKCNKCGLEFDDDIEICPNCGNEINDKETQELINEDSKRCPSCGSIIGMDEFICPSCGNKIAELKIIKKCPSCGEELDEDAVSCDNCGASLSTANQIQEFNNSLINSNKSIMEKISEWII
ncbi:zinc ribbon domain-containing protein [uncultured Methanobrevibacter sp.]|uniref:double zinc ribbon domain-containing protein n=1 Tax=uncultured Methanobrevibacter sp. TaxID=253161 RepID=UPI0026006CD2|nr:zinc ribbon domain-containing protein [uncultured Methanobrevibacter sp.]